HTHEQGRRILKPMELSGYESADDDTYLPVRDFLIKFTHEVRPLQ
ncbi:phosphonate transport system substrate-binding protein, partial [Candidatus Electrothrix marina]